MLVLRRKPKEQFRIAEQIIVKILRVHDDGTVSVGIEAPSSVKIDREEVFQKLGSPELLKPKKHEAA